MRVLRKYAEISSSFWNVRVTPSAPSPLSTPSDTEHRHTSQTASGLPTLFRKFYSYKASETTIVGSLRQVERFPSLHETQSCSTVMY